jgi:hypothetical protein
MSEITLCPRSQNKTYIDKIKNNDIGITKIHFVHLSYDDVLDLAIAMRLNTHITYVKMKVFNDSGYQLSSFTEIAIWNAENIIKNKSAMNYSASHQFNRNNY